MGQLFAEGIPKRITPLQEVDRNEVCLYDRQYYLIKPAGWIANIL